MQCNVTYACMHVCIHACMYACMSVCVSYLCIDVHMLYDIILYTEGVLIAGKVKTRNKCIGQWKLRMIFDISRWLVLAHASYSTLSISRPSDATSNVLRTTYCCKKIGISSWQNYSSKRFFDHPQLGPFWLSVPCTTEPTAREKERDFLSLLLVRETNLRHPIRNSCCCWTMAGFMLEIFKEVHVTMFTRTGSSTLSAFAAPRGISMAKCWRLPVTEWFALVRWAKCCRESTVKQHIDWD